MLTRFELDEAIETLNNVEAGDEPTKFTLSTGTLLTMFELAKHLAFEVQVLETQLEELERQR